MVAYRRNVIPGARYFYTAASADRASVLLIDRVADLRAVYCGVRLETRVSQKTLNPGYIYYDAAFHDLPGDANGDNAYTTADRAVILNQILETATAPGNPDCNQDSQITVQDLVCLNTLITGGAAPALSGTTLFVYNEPGHLIGEYNASGSVIQETVYLGNQPVAVLKQNNLYTIHTDHLNTPRAISDSGRTVVWRWDADPFGTAAADPDPDMNGVKFTYNLRFPGQYFDNETGLHYNYFRDYDPSTGRYIESDPVGLAGGINTYTYVGGNPINYVDPYGLFELPSLPQGVVDAVAGFGDTASFGITDAIRDALDINDVVDQSSDAYTGGSVAGGICSGGAGALRGAAAFGGTRAGHWLNHGRYWRIGPGTVKKGQPFAYGPRRDAPTLRIGHGTPSPLNHFDLRVLGR